MSEYVIIGNSAAAIGCCEGIRSIDRNGTITVISKEKYHTYSRPLISYLIYGRTDREKMKYRPDSFYSDNHIEFISGREAVSINTDEKTVTLDDGSKISYGKLLAATGSYPFVPDINGLETVKNRTTFMSLNDAERLISIINPDSKVMILGAGLIGLKCAEGISGKVNTITVVDMADRILPSILDKEASEIVEKHIEKHGIEFMLSDSVDYFDGNTAVMKSGKKINFDILVTAVGVRPNIKLFSEAGINTDKAIITDKRCETSIKGIYAAGDCTESYDTASDSMKVLALLPNAYMQGECAGVNMAGGSKIYDKATAMNAIGFFGLHMVTCGSYDGSEFSINKKGTYKKLFVKNDLLKGYIIVGDVSRSGIYTSLVREKTPLDSIDFEMAKERPLIMAFPSLKRKQILGGVSE